MDYITINTQHRYHFKNASILINFIYYIITFQYQHVVRVRMSIGGSAAGQHPAHAATATTSLPSQRRRRQPHPTVQSGALPAAPQQRSQRTLPGSRVPRAATTWSVTTK